MSSKQYIRCKPNCLTDLPYQDITFKLILPLLTIDDLFNLKIVCNKFNYMVQEYFKNLKELNLSKAKWLSYQQLKIILSLNHKFITQVDLSYNLSLNNYLLNQYLISFKLNKIKSIKLNDCHWIESNLIDYLIIFYGQQLIELEISGCWNLKDQNIELLAKYCPNLMSLNLAKVYSITDKSLFQLALYCDKLYSLNLIDCWRVTCFGIYCLIQQCPFLAILKINQKLLENIY